VRVLIIGNGQLGSALADQCSRLGLEHFVFSHSDLDISNAAAVLDKVQGVGPDLLFHTAALTKVNYCEEHPQEAHAVNSLPIGSLLTACRLVNARLVLFSTDYVFPGSSGRQPIFEDSKPEPLNAYGRSKWAAEMHVANTWVAESKGHIIRTSGVFGPRPDGSERNFFRAIFDKLSSSDAPIEVVNDQFTCVTYAPHLAQMVLELLPELPRITHLTSAGSDSWYGWARQLAQIAGYDPARIVPVPSDPGSPVRRPAYSVLGSQYERVNRLIGQFPATKGIAEYVSLLRARS
jgi:dTDP-4-dehydrorhamnose reductase